MNQELIDAINNRQVICFYYESLHREVEPHSYGQSPKGEPLLWGFQSGGQSKSGRVPCRRLFDVARIQNLYLAGKNFTEARPGYPKNLPNMEPIFAKL